MHVSPGQGLAGSVREKKKVLFLSLLHAKRPSASDSKSVLALHSGNGI